MPFSEMAKELGRRGGRARAKRLSKQRRQEIARLGAQARMESLRLTKAIAVNFDYVEALLHLSPPPPCTSLSSFDGQLPEL